MALLTDEPRSATVTVTVPAELFSLARQDFLSLLEREPTVRRAVEERVAARRTALAEAVKAAKVGAHPLR